jgi:putative ABC transport system ATP-binding protein
MNYQISLLAAGKSYQSPAGSVRALAPISLDFESGEFVGLVGRSGSGKSTLLNLIAGIDHPSEGEILLNGDNISALSESQLARFRGKNIGIVFQFFNLIPTMSVLENVLLAMDLVNHIPRQERHERALDLLAQVSLNKHLHKFPSQLSGGEQQRVAIARALANDPPIVIADEPTGNLDSSNSEMIIRLFETCAEAGRTVIIATHENSNFERFNRLIQLGDGELLADIAGDELTSRGLRYA